MANRGVAKVEQIFNMRILCDRNSQHQQDLHHVFTDFKKVNDRVWHGVLLAAMKKYNIGTKIIQTIQQMYSKATSRVLVNKKIGE